MSTGWVSKRLRCYGVVGADEDAFVAAHTFFGNMNCFAGELYDFYGVFAVSELLQNSFAQEQTTSFNLGAFLHAAERVFALDGNNVFHARIQDVKDEICWDSACAGHTQRDVILNV